MRVIGSPWMPDGDHAKLGKTELALVAVIVLIAAFFRFYRIDALPQGLYWDEAFNGIDALQILQGNHPIFFEGNNGREPLFIYLQAFSVFLLGPTSLALRIVSALVGLVTVLAEYFLVRRFFGRDSAIFATLGLAVSYWHVSVSRVGFRAILVPFMATLVFYFLWRGLQSSFADGEATRRRSVLWFAISGGCLGLSLYTYTSARFLPMVVVAFLCWAAIFNRKLLRAHFGRLIVLGVIAISVFAPLGIHFFQVPSSFFGRASSVLLPGFHGDAFEAASSVLQGFYQSLGAFIVRGDIEWRYNLSNRPAMDLLTGAALLVGVFASIRRIWRPERILMLLWFAIMLLPSALTDAPPHYLRAMGTLPAAYALVGLGAAQVLARLRRVALFKTKVPYVAILGLTSLIWLRLGPYSTWNDYFHVWANNPKTIEHFEVGMSEAITFLDTVRQPSRILLSTDAYPHPDARFLSNRLSDVVWFDGNQGLPIADDASISLDRGLFALPLPVLEDTYYTFTGPTNRPLQLLKKIYPQGDVVAEQQSSTGVPLFVSFFIPAGAKAIAFSIPHPFDANLGQNAELLGFGLDDSHSQGARVSVNAGDRLSVALYWRALGGVNKDDYIMFLHLIDASGRGWAQSDVKGYPSSEWQNGDIAVSWFEIDVPTDIAPGKYTLKTGMYAYSTMARAMVFDKSGKPVGDSIDLVDVKATNKNRAVAEPGQSMDHVLGEQVNLIGAGGGKDGMMPVSELSLVPDDIMAVRLAWRAEAAMGRDYTVFLQLLDSNGKLVVQTDGQPGAGEYPTSFWDEGDVVIDDHEIHLPSYLTPGQYKLITGMYYLPTGERLKERGGEDSIDLGNLTVRVIQPQGRNKE